jgi:hypothetical protein
MMRIFILSEEEYLVMVRHAQGALWQSERETILGVVVARTDAETSHDRIPETEHDLERL